MGFGGIHIFYQNTAFLHLSSDKIKLRVDKRSPSAYLIILE